MSETDEQRCPDCPHRSQKPAISLLAVVASLVITALYSLYEAPHLGEKAFDWATQLSVREPSPSVSVVHIDESDFGEQFQRVVPLSASVLQRVIEATAAGKPAVIGVDLDTSDPQFSALRTPPGVRVVWARSHDCKEHDGTVPVCGPQEWIPTRVLGGADDGAVSGVATVEFDADDRLRSYTRKIETESGTFPSFASVVLNGIVEHHRNEEGRRLLIRYRRQPWEQAFSTRDVLNLATTPAGVTSLRESLEGRIVLIGATYARARDAYQTPVGIQAGVDVWAQILATEMDGDPLPRPGDRYIAVVMLLEGIVLAFTLHMRRRLASALCSLGVAVVTAVIASHYAGSLALWPFFAPLIVLVACLELYEAIKHTRNRALRSLVDRARKSFNRKRKKANPTQARPTPDLSAQARQPAV